MDNRSIKKIKENLLEIDGISVLKIITEDGINCLNSAFIECDISTEIISEDIGGLILTENQYREIQDCISSSISDNQFVEENLKLLEESPQVFTIYVITRDGLEQMKIAEENEYNSNFQHLIEVLTNKMAEKDQIVLTEAQLLEAFSQVTEDMKTQEENLIPLVMDIITQATENYENTAGTSEILHSYNDEPAEFLPDGTKKWYKDGVLHRDNGPAVENTNLKIKRWYQNGLLHRDQDKPAVIEDGGRINMWYQNGLLHRNNGPAVTLSNGNEEWYQNGLLHRVNGPAISNRYNDKIRKYYKNGELISEITPYGGIQYYYKGDPYTSLSIL